jgi:U3 small nucleolar RNA-associated protein 18
MTAGFDHRLRFFTADGVSNAPVQSLFLDDMPIHTAHFAAAGSCVVASGRRSFFYILDLQAEKIERVNGLIGRSERSLEKFVVPAGTAGACGQQECVAFFGNEGSMPLVSLRSRQVVGELRMSGSVRSATFASGGTQLFTSGSDGSVCLWDVRMQRCVGRFVDEGCVGGSALAASEAHVACGSQVGVVNVYSRASLAHDVKRSLPSQPRPLRALTNLVTVVDTLAFSPGGELLCMASRMEKNSLRLVHLPSLTVFSNWPTSRSPLHCVHAACFSPGGGFLAIGNARGHVLMYRLHHFESV